MRAPPARGTVCGRTDGILEEDSESDENESCNGLSSMLVARSWVYACGACRSAKRCVLPAYSGASECSARRGCWGGRKNPAEQYGHAWLGSAGRLEGQGPLFFPDRSGERKAIEGFGGCACGAALNGAFHEFLRCLDSGVGQERWGAK